MTERYLYYKNVNRKTFCIFLTALPWGFMVGFHDLEFSSCDTAKSAKKTGHLFVVTGNNFKWRKVKRALERKRSGESGFLLLVNSAVLRIVVVKIVI